MPLDVLTLLSKTGALLQGHFRLSSGLHSPSYVQCALLLDHPRNAKAIGEALGARVRSIAAEAKNRPKTNSVVQVMIIGTVRRSQLAVANNSRLKQIVNRKP